MAQRRKFADAQRAMLASSFEPFEGGYLYYEERGSSGIPVSAEEREAYLSAPALGSRRAWQRLIAGRPVQPPRAYRAAKRKLLAAMPTSFIVVIFLFGIPLALSGLAEIQTLGGVACLVVGLLSVVFGGQVAYSKFAEGRQARGS